MKQSSIRSISLVFLLAVTSCTPKNKDLSQNDLVEIYASHELGSISDNQKIIKKYHLNDADKRDKYYMALRELSLDEENYNDFLKKVDAYKKNAIANNPPKTQKVEAY